MNVHVDSTLDKLAADYAVTPEQFVKGGAKTVRKAVRDGNRLARSIARKASGPHGKNYYKRITSEMTAPMVGEFGPTGSVLGNAVGAGWRHGAGNHDLAKAADVMGPDFDKAVSSMIDALPAWDGK